MPKVQPAYLELRKQQIVDAAAGCFVRAGFHQTTMQDICNEAELSPGAIYRYFRSKDEIIQAMCARGHEADADTIRELLAIGSLQQILDQLVQLYFMGTENHEMCALSIELLAESRRDPFILESLRQGAEMICTALAEIVRVAQARGEMKADIDPNAMSRVMLGLYQGLIWQKLAEPGLDPAPYAGAVRALFAGIMTRPTTGSLTAASLLQH